VAERGFCEGRRRRERWLARYRKEEVRDWEVVVRRMLL